MSNILLTGAGSLGQAFIRLLHEDHKLTVYENNEWQVAELKSQYPDVEFVLDDFAGWKFNRRPVDVVIHTAAYKHAPIGETDIDAFIDNNINRTRTLFDEATMGCADILFISSDKAVEPVNLYGYTKAVGEYLTKQHNGYIARCGNFLNSSGSVLPLWEKAIEEDRPIPITDMKMTRYMIEVDQAAKEIWQGYLDGQRLIIPNCQKLTIMDLLGEVLSKHNLELKDVDIEIIGRRPGEKLEEVLKWPNE